MAYGVAAEEVNDTLVHLGDIAAGLSIPLNDLVYLYGTTMTQGRMFTQDLRQFQGRGIPIAEELAKQFGVTKDKVGELVTAGKVGAEEFKKAIMDMSSEGGKFGGLMEAQSKTITGQISNLEDAIDVMFNEIGKQNEGFINDAISGVSYLVEHYKEVGGILLTLISTYGLYKAALIATNAVQSSMQKVEYGKQLELLQKEIEETQKLLPEKMKSANADLTEMVAKKQLTAEQAQHILLMRQEKQEMEQSVKANGMKDALDAQKAALEELLPAKEKSKNADLEEMVASGQLSQEMANEIIKKREALEATLSLVNARKREVDTQLEAAQAELSTAKQNEQIAQNRHEEAERSVSYYEKQLEAVTALGDGEQIEAAENALNTAVSNKNAAARELQAAQTATATAEERVNTLAKEQNAIQTALDTQATGANTVSRTTNTTATTANTAATTGSTLAMKLNAIGAKAAAAANAVLTMAINGVKNAFNAMKVAMMTNPIGAVVGALSLAIGLFASFSSTTSEASAEVERFGESAVKQVRNLETLLAVVDSTSANSKVHKQAVDELCKIYEEYGYKIDEEIDKLEQLKLMHDLVTDAIRREGEERQKANLLASYEEALNKATENMRNTLQDAFENAEWEGSGTLDDWDAEEYQKKAEELTQIIGAIIQSESESLASLTGDELESKINEVNERIKKAYQDMGLELSKSFIKSGGTIGASGYTIDAPVDVDAIQIMHDYAEAIHSVVQGRQALIDSFSKGKEGAEEETKAVDYSTMSIADLAKAASDASDEVSSLGAQSASPDVDASSIDGASEAATGAKDNILQLHGLTSKPLIDTSSINTAIGQTNTLLGNMMQLQSNPMFNTVFGTIGGKPVSVQMPNIPITDPQILARNEMNRRVNNANSQSKVDELMKEVNAALNEATFDSDLYKYLEGVKKQLEARSRKNKSSKKKSDNSRERERKQQERYLRMVEQQQVERERAARDLELSTSQAQIDAMEEGSQKTLAQITLDFEKQREEIKRGYEDLKQKKIDEARQLWEANPANKGQAFNESSVNTKYTDAEVKNHKKQLEALEKERERALEEQYKQEAQALRDYLQEYGTFQEKKLALAEEYAERIRKAQSNGERLSLQREFEAKKNEIDTNRLLENIDMASVFGDFGLLLSEPLKQTVEQLRKLTQTDAFKNRSFDEQKAVFDAIEKAEKSLSGIESLDFSGIGNAVVEYNAALSERVRLEGQLADAAERLTEADGKLIKARQSGNEAAIELAKHEYDEAEAKYNLLRNDYAAASTRVAESQAKATQSLTQFQSTLDKVDSSIRAIYNGSLKGIWDLLGNNLQNKIGGLVSGGLELQNQFDKMVTALTKSGMGIDAFAENLQSKLGEVFSSFTDETTLEEAKNAVNKMIGKVFDDTFGDDDKFDKVASKVGSLIGDLLESGAEKGTAEDTAQSIGQTIGELLKNVGKAGEASGNLWGAIIGVVLQLLDEFAENGLGRFVETLLSKVGDAVSGILGNLFQDLIPSLARGIGNVVSGVIEGVVNMVSFGAAGSFLTGKDHEEEYNKGLEDWKSSIEANTYAVEQLTKKMTDKTLTPEEAQKERDAAISALQGQIASNRGTANYIASDSSSNLFSGYRSWYYKRNNKGFDYSRFNNALAEHGSNTRVNSAQDVLRLSPEDIQILRTYVGQAWADYFGDVDSKKDPNEIKQYLEQIGDLAEKDKEIMNEWYASLTNMTFDALRDNFKSTLKDMSKDRDDFLDDFEEMMFDTLLDEMMSTSGLNKALQDWQKQWGEFIASGNDLSKDEVDELRRQYELLIQQGLDLRDKAAQATGYDGGSNPYEQNATSGGWQSMGQDTADELNGRFTALQMSGERISEGITSMVTTLATLSALADGRNLTLVEIRNLMITNNAFLEDILDANKKAYQKFEQQLDKIVTQTK